MSTETEGVDYATQATGARLTRLNEASLRIHQDLNLEAVLQGIVDGARLLTEARYGALLVFDESGALRNFFTSGVTPDERRLVGNCWPRGRGLLGHLSETGRPLRLRDIATHPASVGVPENHPPVKSFLGAPIPSIRRGVGNIYLSEKEAGLEFTPEDEEIVVMFARQAALAISNAERHRDEQRAKASLEALVQASPVGVLVVDARTRTVVSVNREARRITGVGPGIPLDEYRASASYRRLDGSELPLESHPLEGALARGETVRAKDVVFALSDGRQVTALISATPVFSQDGELISAVGTIQDITPLEELERLRSEFLGMVSHELRAPLTSIVGATAMALGDSRRQDITAMNQLFQIIEQQTNLMGDLINNLLDMTLIEAGSLSVTPAPADVDDLIAQARGSFLRGGASNGVEVDLAEDLPQVLADMGRIVQVLDNLLSNASRYSPRSSTIRIAAVQQDQYVAISVTDEGRGLSAGELPHLFGKFSRLVPGHGERETGGSGLGLAICRGIVEAHGGRIWAESDGPGLGTRFTFTVPMVVGVEDGATNGPTHRPDRPDLPVRQHARILAVDDDPQMLWYIRSTLSEAGYTPIVTGNPDEVDLLLEIERPHLVLLDLVLPGTDGFALMKRISEVSEVPVIFISGHGSDAQVARAFEMGAMDYIAKPFSPTELVARIRASLRRRTGPDRTEDLAPYVLGDLAVDFAARSVTVADEPVKLTATEFELLAELSASAGRVLTQGQLLSRVWGQALSGNPQTGPQLVRAFVRNLRRKLGDGADNPKYIFTEPRVGYRMPKAESKQPLER